MSLGLPGNSVVVNVLMRFPILIPVAAAVGITVLAAPKVVVTPVAPPVVEKKVDIPPLVKPVIKPLPPEKKKKG